MTFSATMVGKAGVGSWDGGGFSFGFQGRVMERPSAEIVACTCTWTTFSGPHPLGDGGWEINVAREPFSEGVAVDFSARVRVLPDAQLGWMLIQMAGTVYRGGNLGMTKEQVMWIQVLVVP